MPQANHRWWSTHGKALATLRISVRWRGETGGSRRLRTVAVQRSIFACLWQVCHRQSPERIADAGMLLR
jgi:hypothetical protein